MAYAYVQRGYGIAFASSVSPTWLGASGNNPTSTTAGNLLVLIIAGGFNSTSYVSSITDTGGAGGTWQSAVGAINNNNSVIATGSANGRYAGLSAFYMPNNPGGFTGHTVNVTNYLFTGLTVVLAEYSGVAGTLLGYSAGYAQSASPGYDLVSSGGITVNAVPALLMGAVFEDAAIGDPAYAPGTTPIAFTGRLVETSGGSEYEEDARIISTGSPACTFGTGTTGTNNLLAVGLAFAEQSAPIAWVT